MEFIDEFFIFPIRIYDNFSAMKAIQQESKALEDSPETAAPVPADWVRGSVRVKLEDIKSWRDYYSEERSPEEVAKEGFDLTLVTTKDENFECLWRREKFEKQLNEYSKRIKEA